MNKKILTAIIIALVFFAFTYIFFANKYQNQEPIGPDEVTKENFDLYCKQCREKNPYCFSCCDITLPDKKTLICQ